MGCAPTLEALSRLSRPNDSRIVLLVLDGLGDLPSGDDRRTALQAARTPNLDRLASDSICGLHEPISPGLTPGSGPAHLALFGYDPLEYQVGRGVLSALGTEHDLNEGDVAARGNFCTIDKDGRVVDRRAGRIETDKATALCERLSSEIGLEGAEVEISPIKEHRFLLILRGEQLDHRIDDTDPHRTGVEPIDPQPKDGVGVNDGESLRKTIDLVRSFSEQAGEILAGESPANMVLLRGFSSLPDWPTLDELFEMKCAALVDYPMYFGVATLVGMEAKRCDRALVAKVEEAQQRWDDCHFYFIHMKGTDSAGEDGDRDRKVERIEAVDQQLPDLLELRPDVLVVTGDHSTPSPLASHSWHPVPVLLHAKHARTDGVDRFDERACLAGGVGPRLPATSLLPLMLAHAGRLDRFGA